MPGAHCLDPRDDCRGGLAWPPDDRRGDSPLDPSGVPCGVSFSVRRCACRIPWSVCCGGSCCPCCELRLGHIAARRSVAQILGRSRRCANCCCGALVPRGNRGPYAELDWIIVRSVGVRQVLTVLYSDGFGFGRTLSPWCVRGDPQLSAKPPAPLRFWVAGPSPWGPVRGPSPGPPGDLLRTMLEPTTPVVSSLVFPKEVQRRDGARILASRWNLTPQ
jgi:hypothetical protein